MEEQQERKGLMFWVRTHKVLTIIIAALLVLVVGSSLLQRPSGVRQGVRLYEPDINAPAAMRTPEGVGVTRPQDSVAGGIWEKNRGWIEGRVNPQEKLNRASQTVPQIYVFLKFAKFRVVYERDASGQFVPERNAAGDVVMWSYGRPRLKIKKIVPYTQWYIATGSGTVVYSGQDPYRSQVGPRYHTLVLTANHIVSPVRYFMRPLPTFLQDPAGRETAYLSDMEILYDWRIEGNLNGTWFPLEVPGVERPKADESLKRLAEAMNALGEMAQGYARGVFAPAPVVTSNLGKMSLDTGLPPDLARQFRGLPYKPISPDVLAKIDPRQLEMPGSAPELDLAVLEARDKVFPKQFVFPFGFGKSDGASLPWGADVWLMGYPSGYNITANAGKVNGRMSFGTPPWINLVKLDVSSTGGFSGGPVLAVDQGFKFVGILLGGLVNIQMTRVPDPELPDFYDPITGLPGAFPRHPLTLIPGEPKNEDLSWDTVRIPIPGFSFMRGTEDIVVWLSLNGFDYIFGFGKR